MVGGGEMIWFILGGILLIMLGFLLLAVLVLLGCHLLMEHVVVPVLTWLDRL